MKSRSENKRKHEKDQSQKIMSKNQISPETTKTAKVTEKRTNEEKNNNTNANSNSEAQKAKGNNGVYSNKNIFMCGDSMVKNIKG